MNEAFQQCVGITKERLIGKTIFETFSPSEEEKEGWLELFREIVLKGEVKAIRQYVKLTEKWFSTRVYSPQKGFFAVLLRDVTTSFAQTRVYGEVEKQFQMLLYAFDSEQDGILILTDRLEILYANRISRKYLGLKFRGKGSIPIDTLELAGLLPEWEKIKTHLQTGNPDGIQTLLHSREGRIIPIEILSHPFEYEGQKHNLLYAHDRSLKQEREQQYRKMLQNLEMIALILDPYGKVAFCNSYTEKILKYEPHALIGKDWAELCIAAEEKENVKIDLQNALQGKEFAIHHENSVLTQEGEKRIIYWHNSILKDEKAEIIGVTAIGEDITERKQYEHMLLKSRDFYLKILDDFPALIWKIDSTGKFDYLNRELSGFLGITFEQEKENTFLTMLHPADRSAFEVALSDGLRDKKTFRIEYRLKHFTGSYRWIVNFGTPIYDMEMKFLGLIGSGYDIQNEKQMAEFLIFQKEEAESSSKIKSQFLANINHELRTPMNGIMGSIQLLRGLAEGNLQKELMELLKMSSENMLHVINKILSFAELDAEKIAAKYSAFNLSDVFNDNIRVLQYQNHEKKLRFFFDSGDVLLQEILGDRDRTSQMIHLLLENAFKFTSYGEIYVRVSLFIYEKGKAFLDATIIDTGIGIPDDKFDKIFEPFVQIDGSKTRRYGGLGIGLTIVSRILEKMNGFIRVESELGEGSAFHLRIPYKLTVAAELAEINNPLQNTRFSTAKNPPVVIIDPLYTNRLLLREDFVCEGFEVHSFPKIEQGLYFCRGIDACLIVTSSIDWVEAILPVCSDLRKKILFVINDEEEFYLHPDIRTKTQGVLHKPFSKKQLLSVLKDLNLRQQILEPYPSSKKLRILVADDDVLNQKMLQLLLAKLGLPAVFAKNGLEVLEQIQKRTFDLIFMDVSMPLKNGYETTLEIRNREKSTPGQTVIIAITANSSKQEKEKCYAAGMNGFLSKPFGIEEIRTVLTTTSKQLFGKSFTDNVIQEDK